jgi:hypothetical protein
MAAIVSDFAQARPTTRRSSEQRCIHVERSCGLRRQNVTIGRLLVVEMSSKFYERALRRAW